MQKDHKPARKMILPFSKPGLSMKRLPGASDDNPSITKKPARGGYEKKRRVTSPAMLILLAHQKSEVMKTTEVRPFSGKAHSSRWCGSKLAKKMASKRNVKKSDAKISDIAEKLILDNRIQKAIPDAKD